MKAILDLITANLDDVIDKISGRILEKIPGYSQVDRETLRQNTQLLVRGLLDALRNSNETQFLSQLLEVTQTRVGQNFAVTDFLTALFVAFPVFRESVRAAGSADNPDLARGFAELEERMHDIGVVAADLYTSAVAEQLKAKNVELNRVLQQLAREKQRLSREVVQTSRELDHATEFNQRVIESLSAGVAVVEADTLEVSLYSSRMEEILGIPTEKILGRTAAEAGAAIEGLDVPALVEAVQLEGRLPMRRIPVTLPSGKRRTLLVRAQRLYDPEGVAEGTVIVIDDASERELLIDSFSRYVSRDLLQRLLAHGELPGLEGECKTCTLLFADIRGFTGLAEKLSPDAVHKVLNGYFEVMVDGIEGQSGFIDKFVGDKIMAIFHAGEPAVGAQNALAAARNIQTQIEARGAERDNDDLPAVAVGIGVNTGEVMLGNVGAARRMEFTAIGDAVNVADRLQGLAKAGEVLCGQATAELVGERMPLVAVGETPIKGREAAERCYQLQWQQ